MDRRQALRLGVLGLTLVGTSVWFDHLADAGPVTRSGQQEFRAVYKGRRIRGAGPRVFVDDVELHVMRCGPGFTTQLNHYQTFPTPYRAARAAVDSLNGAAVWHTHG